MPILRLEQRPCPSAVIALGRWTGFVFLLALGTTAPAADQGSQQPAQSAQSKPPEPGYNPALQRTLDGIKKQIDGTEVNYTVRYYRPDTVIQVSQIYREMRHSGCSVTIDILDLSPNAPDIEISFDLRDLLPMGKPVKMSYVDVVAWKIPFQTVDARELIRDRSGPANYTYLTFLDPERAEAVVRGFDRAISICKKMKPGT
jgi:hypothetical protein